MLGKDVSRPETYVHNRTRDLGGNPLSNRKTLSFFARGMHGYVRPILIQHWENKDFDMKIFGMIPKSKGNMNYIQYMKSSRYCIFPKGYEFNSLRVVEAIVYECVPVIISDKFGPPFLEVLNWELFAVYYFGEGHSKFEEYSCFHSKKEVLSNADESEESATTFSLA